MIPGFSPQPKPGHYLLVLVDPTADLPEGWVRSSASSNVARVRATKELLQILGDEVIGCTTKDCGVDEVPPQELRRATRRAV